MFGVLKRRMICGVLSAVLICIMCGCDKDSGSSDLSVSASSGSAGSTESGAPLERAKYFEDDYTMPVYAPPESWAGMAEEIRGEFGQETDALIPSVFIKCSEEIKRDAKSECTIQIDAGMTDEYPSTKELEAEIRGRGHSTWEWPKKPYKFQLKEKASLLGMTASKEWVLIANYADESLIRNTVAFEMARSLGTFDFTPHAIPVNVYLNGVYQGIYTLGEQIEVKSSRIQLDYREDSPNTGYLLEIGGADPELDDKGTYFDLPSGCAINIAIKAPKDEKLTQENYEYIKKYMTLADEAVTTLNGYETYIDVDSFIDWFLLHELTYNLDSCFYRSCYMTKDRAGKLKMGPVWDFDLAFGNMYMDNPDYDDWATVGSSRSESYIGVNWFNYLMADESFREKARARWQQVRDILLETADTVSEDVQAKIKPSVEDNFRVWNTLDIANGYQPLSMAGFNSYNTQAQCVRRFINTRAEWIDNNL